jgi:hypothetical protein
MGYRNEHRSNIFKTHVGAPCRDWDDGLLRHVAARGRCRRGRCANRWQRNRYGWRRGRWRRSRQPDRQVAGSPLNVARWNDVTLGVSESDRSGGCLRRLCSGEGVSDMFSTEMERPAWVPCSAVSGSHRCSFENPANRSSSAHGNQTQLLTESNAPNRCLRAGSGETRLHRKTRGRAQKQKSRSETPAVAQIFPSGSF